jgi:hypothetical protein
MAQFRAVIRGQRGEASRLGSKSSGIVTHTNGWDVGVMVCAMHRGGKDIIEIHLTGGSHHRARTRWIGEVDSDGVWTPAPQQG